MDATEEAASPPDLLAGLTTATDAAVVAVSLAADDGPRACLVGFHTQVSITPPRYLVCLSTLNATTRAARSARHLAVNVLGADAVDLARTLGSRSARDDPDKAASLPWEEGPGGVPLVAGAIHWVVGSITERVGLGDHEGLVLAPVAVDPRPSAAATVLRYHQVADLDPGAGR